MKVSPIQAHRCHVCHRSYKRPEHLQRHLTSHRLRLSHVCKACDRSFSRSDALKRHLRTCPEQHGTETQRSSRRRACDRCVRLKRACDSDDSGPCETCLAKSIPCTFTLHEVDPRPETFDQIHIPSLPILPLEMFEGTPWENMDSGMMNLAATTWDDFLSLTPNSVALHKTGQGTHTLRFLDNFTKHSGLVNSFDCGAPEIRLVVAENASRAFEQQNEVIDPKELEKYNSLDPLAQQCREIVALIKEVAIVKPRNSVVEIVWSDLTEDLCSSFFNPVNLRKCLELYWAFWHPNVNFVHRPTLNPVTAKPILLAAMSIIGACVSPYDDDRMRARYWFNSVEEIVFIDDDFCNDSISDGFPTCAKIQAMQAAYIVCLYQNWEGTDRSKQRTRRHRFSTLVSTARDISMHNAKHPCYHETQIFQWADFAAREQLIRVFLWIFLLDTAFVIFNNLPPRMVITEMNMNFASCEAVFQAESEEICHSRLLTRSRVAHKDYSLHQAAKMLCNTLLDDEVTHELADLGPLNLFAMISSLHPTLFHYQNSFHTSSQLIPIRNSLQNWKSIWTSYTLEYASTPSHAPCQDTEVTAGNMWQRIGFMRFASEYWLLASLVLDRICVAETESLEQVDGVKADGRMISETTVSNPVLSKYDQTSMQQVNDLIAHFQKTSI